MKTDKYENKSIKIVDSGIKNVLKFFNDHDNYFDHDQSVLYFTLCFYPEYDIKFFKSDDKNTMFNSDDIYFNGDILIGISSGMSKEGMKWIQLKNIIKKRLQHREILLNKKTNKMFDIPNNISVRNYLANNFADNIISAHVELQEYGNTQTGALYKIFLDKTDILQIDFFNELKKLWKKKIIAEI